MIGRRITVSFQKWLSLWIVSWNADLRRPKVPGSRIRAPRSRTRGVREYETPLQRARRKARVGRALAGLFVFSVSAVAMSAYYYYAFYLHKDQFFLAEFVSYAAAAIAALVAGLNVYVRREVAWFWLSGILVALGLIAFIASEEHFFEVARQAVLTYGAVCAFFAYPALRAMSNPSGKQWRWINVACFGFSLLLFAGVYIGEMLTKLAPADAAQMICAQTSGPDGAGTVVLACKPAK